MRRTSAASRTFLLAVALLAGCSIYEPSLLVDAPPDYGEGGSDGDAGSNGDAGTGGTDGEAGSDGEAGEGGSDGEAGEGGSDGEAGEGGSDGEAGEGGSGGATTQGGSSGAAGKAGAGGSGGAAGKAGSAGAAGAGGVAGKSGAGGAAGSTTAGAGGATGGSAGATGGKGGSAGGGACDGRVLINEISTEKGAVKSDELVELYNPTACEIVLTGWVLKYAASSSIAWLPTLAWTGSETAKIAPGGYFVIGSANFISGGGVASEEGKLGISSPAGVGLFTSAAETEAVDRVAWGAVAAGSPAVEGDPSVAPSSSKSIGRSSTSADTNNNLADFTDQARSPGAANP